jgi:transposase
LHQRTHVQHVQTESVSDTSRLLDLDGLAVDPLESDAFGGRVVHVVTADRCAAAWPGCGAFLRLSQGSGVHRAGSIPYGVTRLRLIWHRLRWRCKERRCGRSSVTESLPAVRTRSRLTTRVRAELGWAVAQRQRCVSESAVHYGAIWLVVHTECVEHVRVPLAAPPPSVKVLGID